MDPSISTIIINGVVVLFLVGFLWRANTKAIESKVNKETWEVQNDAHKETIVRIHEDIGSIKDDQGKIFESLNGINISLARMNGKQEEK